MTSWPATLVDWGVLTPRLRDGDQVCIVHGLVDAELAEIGIPVCPHCRQATMRAQHARGRLVGFVSPAPARCAAAERHPLTGGRVSVSWTACRCRRAVPGPGGHRIWLCHACVELGRDQAAAAVRWPPCESGRPASA